MIALKTRPTLFFLIAFIFLLSSCQSEIKVDFTTPDLTTPNSTTSTPPSATAITLDPLTLPATLTAKVAIK